MAPAVATITISGGNDDIIHGNDAANRSIIAILRGINDLSHGNDAFSHGINAINPNT